MANGGSESATRVRKKCERSLCTQTEIRAGGQSLPAATTPKFKSSNPNTLSACARSTSTYRTCGRSFAACWPFPSPGNNSSSGPPKPVFVTNTSGRSSARSSLTPASAAGNPALDATHLRKPLPFWPQCASSMGTPARKSSSWLPTALPNPSVAPSKARSAPLSGSSP